MLCEICSRCRKRIERGEKYVLITIPPPKKARFWFYELARCILCEKCVEEMGIKVERCKTIS